MNSELPVAPWRNYTRPAAMISPLSHTLPLLRAAAAKACDVTPSELLHRWLSRLSPSAVAKYRRALQGFATWALAVPDAGPEEAMRLLVDAGPGRAHSMVESWRDELLATGRAPGTVAGNVSALGSLVKALRRAGVVSWSLEGLLPRPEKRLDRRGPMRHEVERLLAHMDELAAGGEPTEIRNVAIVRLLHNAALRRAEVVALRYPDDVQLDGPEPVVMPRRKGRRERAPVTIGRKAAESMRRWIEARGSWVGPLFVQLHIRGAAAAPLTGEAVRQLLTVRARQAGVRSAVRPHGLRHASASEIARRGSLDELQALGQWKTLSAAAHYLDQRDATRLRAVAMVEA